MRVITGGNPRNIVPRFLAATLAADRAAIEAIGDSLNGPDRPLIATFATMALTPGQLGTEDDTIDPNAVGGPRGATERTLGELATRGARSAVVRLPPVVHGDGDRGGFVPQMIKAARKSEVSSYGWTEATGGPPCTASTRHTCSCRRSNMAPPVRPTTGSPKKASRSSTSPPRSAVA